MSDLSMSTWGLIEVRGPESGPFLHTQLTNSIDNLPEGELRLAAFCTAKGRLQGTFFVWKDGESYHLLCRRDTIAFLVKRLSMFKLRSKCEISDQSAHHQIKFAPVVEQAPMSVVHQEGRQLTLALREATPGESICGLHITPSVTALEYEESPTQGDNRWEAALQALGIAYVSKVTQDMFIPQAINLDLVGAIHFEKGCYPGQEVVARSHYIGKVKRRSFLATLAQPDRAVHPGQDVWMIGKTNEPAGTVVTVTYTNEQLKLMVELVARDAMAPDSRFSLEGPDSNTSFTVSQPGYNVMEKGNQFSDQTGKPA